MKEAQDHKLALLAPLLLVLSVAMPPLGGGLAKDVSQGHDILALSFLRNALAALVMLLVVRPSFRDLTPVQWRAAVALGAALAIMNANFYLALARLPLGVAVAIEFLGPLGVAMIGARRIADYLWPALALVGVLLLTPLAGTERLDPLGLMFAIITAGGWAAYILLSRRVGQAIPGMKGLALALLFATLFTLPVGLPVAGPYFASPEMVAKVVAVSMLSTLLPYALEFVALRHVSTALFGIMMALEPALSAVVGLLLLGEVLSLSAVAAIALICAAAVGSSLARR
ncbi:EamA family transporter [Niveispirillum sp. KHB5.9]|uniref:EamA family transporter n=1 Tax=Niveispirillum sp. KHB5.9 TaxID=3400269 RepID=UPI003A877E9A